MQQKIEKKIFSFSDNCMWMRCIKLSLLGREHLSTAVIVLRNSLKLFHITKRDFLPLNCIPLSNEYGAAAVVHVETELGPVYHVRFWRVIWWGTFTHISSHFFSQAVASELNKLWASIFFWKYSILNLDFENTLKNP